MQLRRQLVSLALPISLVVACACSSDGGGSGSEGVAASGEGLLIVATSEGIYEQPPGDGERSPIIRPEQRSTFVLDPAVSPGGDRLAYIEQPPPRLVDGMYDAGTNLMIADRDGANAPALYTHEQPNQLVRFPRWFDGNTVFAIVQEITTDGGVSRVVYTLQRFDVTTGERQLVLQDVLQFDISPDGRRIVYAKLAPATGETLEIVDIDGRSNSRTLVPVDEMIAPFNTPRFSPDGTRIAFAGADQTQAPPLGRRMSGSVPVSLKATAIDGLPQDIWMVDREGGRPQLVAELKEDLPSLTWDGTGERIFVLGVQAIHEVDVETGGVRQLGPGVFHGQITWAPGD